MKHFDQKELRLNLRGLARCSQFFAPIFADRSDELFIVALLDEYCEVIELLAFNGNASQVEVGVAQLFQSALCVKAEGLILAHNHPSGDDRPSRSDKILTRSIEIAAEALDLNLIDHLIFGEGDVFSFRRHSLL